MLRTDAQRQGTETEASENRRSYSLLVYGDSESAELHDNAEDPPWAGAGTGKGWRQPEEQRV